MTFLTILLCLCVVTVVTATQPVAFSARLTHHTVADDDLVLFEDVSINLGGGYDPYAGRCAFGLILVLGKIIRKQ